MLCGCQGDRWPIQCLMANEVEMGFYKCCGVVINHIPCLANLLASSFPMMFVWPLNLRMVIQSNLVSRTLVYTTPLIL